MNLFKIAKAVY